MNNIKSSFREENHSNDRRSFLVCPLIIITANSLHLFSLPPLPSSPPHTVLKSPFLNQVYSGLGLLSTEQERVTLPPRSPLTSEGDSRNTGGSGRKRRGNGLKIPKTGGGSGEKNTYLWFFKERNIYGKKTCLKIRQKIRIYIWIFLLLSFLRKNVNSQSIILKSYLIFFLKKGLDPNWNVIKFIFLVLRAKPFLQ